MGETILDTIAAHTQKRVAAARAERSLETLQTLCQQLGPGRGAERFSAALRRPGLSLICEVKKASPSKGIISPDFPYQTIARDYEAAGADAISCLTEPEWFLGSDQIFREIREETAIPMLRKDFTVDPYQLYEARLLEADCVLLICSLLDTETLFRYLKLCEELGLAALTEAHSEEEIASALEAGAQIIGVNNRNLKDFSVDFANARRLRDLVPPDILFVAESRVRGPEDIRQLRALGADAALIGETLMRSTDKRALLTELREAGQ